MTKTTIELSDTIEDKVQNLKETYGFSKSQLVRRGLLKEIREIQEVEK